LELVLESTAEVLEKADVFEKTFTERQALGAVHVRSHVNQAIIHVLLIIRVRFAG
jgi:hypothetical protein